MVGVALCDFFCVNTKDYLVLLDLSSLLVLFKVIIFYIFRPRLENVPR